MQSFSNGYIRQCLCPSSLNDPKLDAASRRSAANCLGAFGSEARAAVESLGQAMSADANDYVRVASIRALQKIGAADFDAEAAVAQSHDRDYQEKSLKYAESSSLIKPFTSELPPVTRVEINRLGFHADANPKKLSSKYVFPVRPDRDFVDVAIRRMVEGPDAEKVAAAWRGLRFGLWYRAMCHDPAVGLRFYGGKKLLLETSVCFHCQNFYRDDHWIGFDAHHPSARKFQELLDALVPPPEQ